jgi:hypothetical protein
MSGSTARRPLPALAFLLALTVLTSIVWWRVLHRTDASSTATTQTRSSSPKVCSPPPALPAPHSVSVQVFNSTDRSGIATAASDTLRSRGFAIAATPTDATPTVPGVAEVRYGPSGKAGAMLLGYYFPGAKLVPANRPDARVDVVLGNAFRAVATPGQVSQAIAAAKRPC